MNAFFREHPERRPCLLKRLGQQLIVAAEAQDGVVPYLKQVGIFRHKAYYAIDDASESRRQFLDYCVEERLEELLLLNIPDHVLTLREKGRDALAAHAAGGWTAEIEYLANCHSEPSRIQSSVAMPEDLSAERPWIAAVITPEAVVNRLETTRFLSAHSRIRRLWDAPFSPHRHLARLRWPQSPLFPEMRVSYAALREQLFHFVRGKWPIEEEDEVKHRAIAACLRYAGPGQKKGWYLER